MEEISLHILDLAQNSISASATCVEITIAANTNQDDMSVTIKDNGKGMTPAVIKQVDDPFYTTRTTRKVGMGIPLFKAIAQLCDGEMTIHSVPREGTVLQANFKLSHIDRPPMGQLDETMVTLVLCNPEVDFILTVSVDERMYCFNTHEVKEVLDGVPINEPEVITWIRENVCESLENTYGGIQI